MPEGSMPPYYPTRGTTPRLPDQLAIKFGPLQALGQFFLRKDRYLRDHGIRASLCFDFEELAELNRRYRDRGWFVLPPMFDPQFADIGQHNAFWLKGVNGAGDTVLAHAMRLYVFSGTTLARETRSMRLIYDRGIDDGSARADVACATAEAISGRVAFMGALWLHEAHRGHGLAGTISPITRALGLATWFPDFACSFVSTASVRKGRAALYGWPAEQVEPGIRLSGLPGGHDPIMDFSLCYMTGKQIEAAVIAATEGSMPTRGSDELVAAVEEPSIRRKVA